MTAKKPLVTYHIVVEQDDLTVRGNAMVSGDDAADKEIEDEILSRLNRGDVWAWAWVKVVASCQGFEGYDTLGGCCYKDEEDFKKDGYFESMKAEALHELKRHLENAASEGKKAAELLKKLS